MLPLDTIKIDANDALLQLPIKKHIPLTMFVLLRGSPTCKPLIITIHLNFSLKGR